MMNQEIKELWLTRLESGEVQQAQGKLHKPQSDSFCCLGVLCEIAHEQGIVSKKSSTSLNYTDYGQTANILPREVIKWAGLHDVDPKVKINHSSYRLSVLNDQGSTFKDLAILIREQL